MSKKQLPSLPSVGFSNRIRPVALDKWNPDVRAASDDSRTISIYEEIGYDMWTGDGFTAKRVSGILRSLGSGPITVNINSPGGDVFEGIAIYNLLREHDGEVTVNVVGLAASIASVIAMAGDNIRIAKSAFFMIHNAWTIAMGNRNDMQKVAETLQTFDQAIAEIYADRTGVELESLSAEMDAETWITGTEAVEQGWADSILDSDEVEEKKGKGAKNAARRIENALRKTGMSKSEAIALISEIKSSEGDPVGSGEGDPTERSEGDPVSLSETAAIAASLLEQFSN